MANPFFTFVNPFTANSQVRSEEANAIFEQIERGFDLLPSDLASLSTGGQIFVGELVGKDTYTATTPSARVLTTAGDRIVFIVPEDGANTGPSTLSVNGGTAYPLVRNNGQPLLANDLTPGVVAKAHPNTPNTCLLYTSPSPRD